MKMAACLALGLALLLPPAATATVIVTVTPAAASVAVGEPMQIHLDAEFGAPDLVLAWGLDLVLDAPLVATSGEPVLGPSWLAFATPDGDGLGGVALAGVSGAHRLASLTLVGLAPGVVEIGLAVTPRDRNEGFALDPTGFASDVVFAAATLLVVPEPRTLVLVLAAASWAAFRAARCAAR